MREFTCANLGYQCNWKYMGRTEELIVDVVGLHLRDVHEVQEVDADLIGKIKNSLSNPSDIDARKADELVMKEFNCKDLGTSCGWHYIAQTEELLADGVAVHAREAHGIKEFTPELSAKVKVLAHAWRG